MTKKVLVLGASGMLGSMVLDFFSSKPDLKITGTLRNKAFLKDFKRKYKNVNITTSPPQKMQLPSFDFIVNCIGIIPQKSKNAKEMVQTNSLLPHQISLRAKSAKIIQIASDCVFSGNSGNYTEKDLHDASEIYGKSKSLGEVDAKNFFNIRTSIIGPDRKSKISLMEWFLNQKKNATVNGYANHYWNGITTLHFAKLCYALINNDIRIPNTFHFVPQDSLSKYNLLKICSKLFNRQDILIKKTNTKTKIDRTLTTIYKKTNRELWKSMGYKNPPTIEKMIQELAIYIKVRNFYT